MNTRFSFSRFGDLLADGSGGRWRLGSSAGKGVEESSGRGAGCRSGLLDDGLLHNRVGAFRNLDVDGADIGGVFSEL